MNLPNPPCSGLLVKTVLFYLAARLFFLPSATAFNNEPVTRLGTANGLSNNSVTSIFRDHAGFMWFGTYDGLNKYDGYTFTSFRNRINDSTSLVGNRIACIGEDDAHDIWVGTKNGLAVFDRITGHFKQMQVALYQTKNSVVPNITINQLLNDGSGNMLVADGDYGLLLYEKKATAGRQIPCVSGPALLTRYHAETVFRDSRNRIWVLVYGIGLCRYDKAAGVLRIVNSDLTDASCIAEENTTTFWIGGIKGLYKYDPDRNAYLQTYSLANGTLSCDKVTTLWYTRGKLWIATDGGGVDILDCNTGERNNLQPGTSGLSISSTAVYALFVDNDDRKWIGTLRGGINIIDPGRRNFATVSKDPLNPNSLINDFVLCFEEEPSGKIWIGTDGGGLSYWDRENNQFSNFSHVPGKPGSLSNNFVTSIRCDYRQRVWVSTYGAGINRYNRSTRSFDHYPCIDPQSNIAENDTWALYEDHNKRLWAGVCDGGLYYFNDKQDRFELFDNRIRNVLALQEDAKGTLWAGTYSKLYRLNTSTREYKGFDIGRPVRCIREDKAGNLWIGTEGYGLLLFDRASETYKQYSMADGLSNNTVMTILEDEAGNLWISTFNGLSCFNPSTKKFTNFYEGDGLPGNEFKYNAALITRKGEFFFGGLKGFSIFYPAKLRMSYKMPPLRLTDLQLGNIPIGQLPAISHNQGLDEIQEITVPYDQAILSVNFVAIEYTAPDKIRYAYYLEGWDRSWNYVGTSRTANYTHLTEGSYRLHIKSTDAAGNWNSAERIIRIIVTPPWYRSWWAYTLYAVFALVLVLLYVKYKTRQTRLQYEIKLAHIEREKERELNEKKITFFTNVSHEFRAPLSLIANPLREMLYSSTQPIDPGELAVVYRNAKRMLSLVDQLLLFTKAGEHDQLRVSLLNFAEVCKEVFLCFNHQASRKNINYRFVCGAEDIPLYIDREKAEIILFNIISNALKYTPADGEVVCTVAETDDRVRVIIRDSGPGIPSYIGNRLFEKFYQVKDNRSVSKSGFGIGLYVAKNYMDLHQATITYTSTGKEGTAFHLSFKKGADHFDPQVITATATHDTVLLEELLEDAAPPAMLQTVPEAADEVPEELLLDSKTLLLVDDDVEMRGYLARIFGGSFKLYQAGNGATALELLKKHTPDLVISDVMMQGMSGVELCTAIKQDEAFSHIPVVLLTGSSSTDLKLKGVECGADDYISKPFEKELLVARVNTILRSRNNLQKYFYNEVTLQQNSLKISAEYKQFLEKCIAIVEKYLDDETFTVKVLVREIGMSHSNVYRKVKSISGQSVNSFIRFIRLRKAAELFINTDANVNEVAFSVGFSDSRYFRTQFHKLFGINPSEYLKKYRKSLGKNFTVSDKIKGEKG